MCATGEGGGCVLLVRVDVYVQLVRVEDVCNW